MPKLGVEIDFKILIGVAIIIIAGMVMVEFKFNVGETVQNAPNEIKKEITLTINEAEFNFDVKKKLSLFELLKIANQKYSLVFGVDFKKEGIYLDYIREEGDWTYSINGEESYGSLDTIMISPGDRIEFIK